MITRKMKQGDRIVVTSTRPMHLLGRCGTVTDVRQIKFPNMSKERERILVKVDEDDTLYGYLEPFDGISKNLWLARPLRIYAKAFMLYKRHKKTLLMGCGIFITLIGLAMIHKGLVFTALGILTTIIYGKNKENTSK